MGEKDIKFVMANPHHVHKTKESDDSSPSKNDRKDPHVIAGLVRDGRYFYSYMPIGIYAELRNASNRRFVLAKEQTRAKNRLQKWIAGKRLNFRYDRKNPRLLSSSRSTLTIHI